MSRILLINPPIRATEPPRHIPYGLAQIGAVLDENGFEVGLLDINGLRVGFDSMRQEIKQDPTAADFRDWDWIGIGGLITTYKWLEEALPHIIKSKPEGCPVLVGGGLCSSIPEYLLKWLPDIDIGVIGEAEETVIEFTQLLDENDGELHTMKQELHDIDGLVFRDSNDYIWRTDPRKLMTEEELNELPYPMWDLLPLDNYFMNSPLNLSPEAMMCTRRLDVISQRGCPFKCTFCFHNQLGGYGTESPVRFQSPEYIVNMIKEMRLKYSIDFVSFLDESMLTNYKRTFELCDKLEGSGVSQLIRWGCLGRPDQMDMVLLKRMKSVGCTYVSMGGESANDQVLKALGKHVTRDQVSQGIRYLFRSEITPICTFMTGYPESYGGSIDEMIETVEFWDDHRISCRSFFVTPYPKTEMFEEFKDEILKQYEWADDPMREFVKECGDATKLVVNLSQYTDVELLGLRDLMTNHDLRRLKEFKKQKES